jgi:preprotein translocase subunit YajC
MNRETRLTTRQNEIQRLSRDIENLATRLNQLILEENQETRENQLQESDDDYQIGDRVQITNNYRGLRGTQGIVTNVTAQQVSIQIEGNRRPINKKKTNVRRVATAAEVLAEQTGAQ